MKAYIRPLVFVLLSALIFNAGSGAIAETSIERRIKAGVRLFRTILAADLDISGKKNQNGDLFILMVFADSQKEAEKLGRALKISNKTGKESLIRGMPIKVAATSDLTFQQFADGKVAGIFITQNLRSRDLKKVVQYGIDNHVIVYSPFEGHVEKGVLGGISVEARVRPYVNIKTMEASGIRIKPFFMKVTKRYE